MFRLNVLLTWLPFAVLGSLLAYVLIAKPFDWTAVLNHIELIPAVVWAQLLGVFVLSYGARIARWCLFTRVLGLHVPWWRNAVVYMAGFGLGIALKKAGEAMRVLYLRRHGMGYAQGLGAFLADRMLDLLVAGLLACSGIALFTGHPYAALMATVACLLGMWALRSSLVRGWVLRLPLGRLAVHARDGMQAMAVLLSGRTLWQAGLLSAVVWCVQGSALYLTLLAMGWPLDWHLAVAVYAMGLFAGAVAVGPGGLGAAEAAITLLLVSQGVDKEAALAAAIVSRGALQWSAMALGLMCLSVIGPATAHARDKPPGRVS